MAGSGDHTHIDPEAVRSAASNIGGLLGDMSPFEKCTSTETKAGNFGAAQWLEEVVQNRQKGLLEHVNHVKLVVGDIDRSLNQVTDALEDTDDTNARQLDRVVGHEVNVLKINAYEDGEKVREVGGSRLEGSQE